MPQACRVPFCFCVVSPSVVLHPPIRSTLTRIEASPPFTLTPFTHSFLLLRVFHLLFLLFSTASRLPLCFRITCGGSPSGRSVKQAERGERKRPLPRKPTQQDERKRSSPHSPLLLDDVGCMPRSSRLSFPVRAQPVELRPIAFPLGAATAKPCVQSMTECYE